MMGVQADQSYAHLPAQRSPSWAAQTVLYEVFVRDFSPAGNFRGVEARLDELRDLGVTMLWLMPIHPTGRTKRKGRLGSPYSVRDYYAIAPQLGSAADFRRLVEAAHKLDIRLILDMVPNHTAWDNELIQQHPDWYSQSETGEMVSPHVDWDDTADLNYDNQDLQRYIQEMLAWWLTEYGVDGFRIDVAELMPGEFWLETRHRLEQINPEIFMLAEGELPYLHVSGFDASYALNTFAYFIQICTGKADVESIHRAMENEQSKFPTGSLRMRFLENHDQARAAAAIPHYTALCTATAAVFCLPGIPMIYNGVEIASQQRLELFDSDPIDWHGGVPGFRGFLKQLLALRKSTPPLIHGDYQPISWLPAGVLGFTRTHANRSVGLIFNLSDERVQFPRSALGASRLDRVLLEIGGATLESEETVRLPPWSGLVLRLA